MNKYPRYKASGAGWIDEIPEGWDMIKIKYQFKDHSGNGFPEALQNQLTGDYPFFKVSDINKNGIYVEKSNNYVSNENVNENKWNIVPKYSIISAKIGEALRKNHRKISIVNSIIDNNCIALTPRKMDIIFSYFQLCIIDFEWFVNPGAIPSVSIEKLRNFYVLKPPLHEQKKIADFLRIKTSEIDSLIKKKEKLVDTLREEINLVLNDAITKGINPKVKLKESGIEWLGKIPQHWKIKKLKYLAKLRNELVDNCDFKIAVENIEGKTGKLINTDEEKSYQGKLSVFKKGDTIFNKLRPYLHKVYFAENDGGLFGELLIIFSTGELISKFLFYKLFSKYFIDIVDSSTQGTKMPRANWNDFISQLSISFPKGKNEQLQIVDHIDTETKRIDNNIFKIQKEIKLLREYRTALISEIVTGKIRII